MSISLCRFWHEQAAWSEATFGPTSAKGPIGALKHLQKEVEETLAAPHDLEEYVDCLFLIFDATRRAGFRYDQLVDAAFEKLEKNKSRKWGDWRAQPADTPVEHIR